MRHITTWLAWSTLVLAIIIAYLYRQLDAAHERDRRALVSERGLRGEVERLEQVRAGLETALHAARRAPSLDIEAPQPTSAAPGSAPRATTQMSPTGMPRPPEMTDEQRQWLTRRRYQGIFRELGLSQGEIAAALPVLVQQDQRANKSLQKEPVGRPEEQAQRDQAGLAAALGADKAERFAAQRKLLPVRSDVKMLRMRLEESEHPLSTEQQDSLLKILASRSSDFAPPRVEGEDWRQSQERMSTWMREREQRLQKDAAPVLTPAQRELLQEEAKFQDAMRARVPFMGGPPGVAALPAAAGSSAPASHGP